MISSILFQSQNIFKSFLSWFMSTEHIQRNESFKKYCTTFNGRDFDHTKIHGNNKPNNCGKNYGVIIGIFFRFFIMKKLEKSHNQIILNQDKKTFSDETYNINEIYKKLIISDDFI